MVSSFKEACTPQSPAPLSPPEAERKLRFHQEPCLLGNPPGLVQASNSLDTNIQRKHFLRCAVECCHGEERGK